MNYDEAQELNAAIRSIGIRHRALAGVLLGRLGLYPGQEVLLLELDHGPRSQAQLAAASGCEPPTITHSVRKLEAAGLVVRSSSPIDARLTIVELSERGRKTLPELKAAWRELAERTVAGLSTTSGDDLTRVVSDLAASLRHAGGAVDRA